MTGTLAANIGNKFDILHSLPLMEWPRLAQAFERSIGVHCIVVPSDHGGRLVVGFGSTHKSPDHALTVIDPSGNKHTPDISGHVRIDIPEGGRGTGVFLANVYAKAGKYSIFATFDEVGYAREKDGSHLIPWNFWYWPFAHSKKDETAWGSSFLFPLAHYEEAFGIKGGELTKWENEHHGDPEKTQRPWAGHCQDAARASVLFRAPPDEGITRNGVVLTCEDLKFYATEFVGRFGEIKRRWTLPPKEPGGRRGPLHENRPCDDPEAFGRWKVLGCFLHTLRTYIRDQGKALIMDLRDATGNFHGHVWNQAVYQYATRYWQEKSSDLELTEGRSMLFANGDFMPPGGVSSGLPAEIKIVHGEPEAHPNGTGREQTCLFTLRFKANGQVDRDSNDARWRSVQYKTTDLHAPRYASHVEKPRASESYLSDGNPFIDRGETLSMISLRTKFE